MNISHVMYPCTITNTAEYKFSINNTHNITALVGQEGVDNKSENFTASFNRSYRRSSDVIACRTQ
jgi:hypothetical protein